MNEKYFASQPTEEIGGYLKERVDDYYKYLNGNAMIDLWRHTFRQFHKGYFDKGLLQKFGKQAEKRRMNINHFRSLLEHIKVLTTDQRPVFEPRAANTDYKSMAQTILARQLLDYYMKQEHLEDVIDSAVNYALIGGEGWIVQEWDHSVGEVVGEIEPVDEEAEDALPEIKRQGNIKSRSFHPIDIIRDYTKNTTEGNKWYIVRDLVNKFELAAKYPKFHDKIVAMSLAEDYRISTQISNTITDNGDNSIKWGESDNILLYVFRHDKTAAMPEGRQVEFLDDETVIFDGDLPYKDLSMYCLMPGKMKDFNMGYTIAYDLLPIQTAIDMLDSTIITNQSTFGVQNITARKGSGVTPIEITGGLNLVEYNGDQPPAPLKLLSTPAEIFKYKEDLIKQMETISGVNSVSRGNPEASLKSGAALALVQSMAIQFNSGLQHSYAQLLEDTGSGTINMLKEYANAPRVAMIAGTSNRAFLKEFTADDLDQIDRVIVDMGNPMSSTLSGRMTIADTLLERGLIKNPDQYIALINTGRMEPLTEGVNVELLAIKSENELMFTGGTPVTIATDNHQLHITEHKTVIASPESRKEESIVNVTLHHINEHINALQTVDPNLLMLTGQQPIQMQPTQMGPGNQGPQKPPEAPGIEGPKTPTMPGQPSLPNNPMTGEQFNPETGGL